MNWHLENRKIASLKEWDRNPRLLTEKGIKDLAKSIKKFGVSAKTELNDGVLWRSSKAMRQDLEKAVKEGDASKVRKLTSRIDRHDREMRLSDHAALFAKVHFFPHKRL